MKNQGQINRGTVLGEKIYELSKQQDVSYILDIGTWTGASALYFAELIKIGNKEIKFYTIDTFLGSDEHLNKYSKLMIDDGLFKYFTRVSYHWRNYIKVIRGDSQKKEISDLFNDGSVACIFFDGDHTHKGILKDLQNWFPKIKEKGIISGHDYIWGGKGVKPIVDKFSNNKARRLKKSVWYYEKSRSNK